MFNLDWEATEVAGDISGYRHWIHRETKPLGPTSGMGRGIPIHPPMGWISTQCIRFSHNTVSSKIIQNPPAIQHRYWKWPSRNCELSQWKMMILNCFLHVYQRVSVRYLTIGPPQAVTQTLPSQWLSRSDALPVVRRGRTWRDGLGTYAMALEIPSNVRNTAEITISWNVKSHWNQQLQLINGQKYV